MKKALSKKQRGGSSTSALTINQTKKPAATPAKSSISTTQRAKNKLHKALPKHDIVYLPNSRKKGTGTKARVI